MRQTSDGTAGDRPDGWIVGRLDDVAAGNALLRAALTELRDGALSEPVARAVALARVSDRELDEFLGLVVDELTDPAARSALAPVLVGCIDARGVGHDALDRCLHTPGVDRAAVGRAMVPVRSPIAAAWCHTRVVTMVGDDAIYLEFVAAHLSMVLGRCFDEMTAYLLVPDRGPGGGNLATFDLVLRNVATPAPFRQRLIEWLHAGRFDAARLEGRESATTLYRLLGERRSELAFVPVLDAAHRRVHDLLRSHDGADRRIGLYHLVAMVDAGFRDAGRVVTRTLVGIADMTPDDRELLTALRAALVALAASQREPSSGARRAEADASVADALRMAADHGLVVA